MRLLLTAFLTIVLHSISLAADLDLLPIDKPVTARVMQIGTSPEVVRITERLGAAVARRPDWFVAYAKEHRNAKGALPWHANMDISQDEYRKMVGSSKTLKLMQMSTVRLSAAREASGAIRLRTTPRLPGLDGIVIEPGGQAVGTRRARLAEMSKVDNRDADGPTGRWTGTQWQHEVRSATHVLGIKLALGKRTDHGDGILYLDVRDIGEGRKDIFYEILLFPVGQ